ncbi:GTP-binding protein Di-Ras1-like [Lethenteron reissneri]|uniref:GTP-binding protein Di-Ras1-like n=1 Tax=Lethenteron reissneri TaxID=7753 RepID=UPI002AB72DE4|nr:GTP-binding protein Di-Ras1-like [Lethenteron reissneri]
MKQQLSHREQEQQQHAQRARVVFFGAAGTGKSSLIRRFLSDSFDPVYKPTVEELHRFNCGTDAAAAAAAGGGRKGDVEFILELLDTAGSYSFPAMRRLAVRSGDAFVLAFSVDDPDSFEEVTRIRDEILVERATLRDERLANGHEGGEEGGDAGELPRAAPRILVVGCKSDSRETTSTRAVAKEEAACVTELDWGHRYVEASAKDGGGVMELFQELVGMVKGPGGDVRLSAEARRAQFRNQAKRQQQQQQQRSKERPKRAETFPKVEEARPPGIKKANSCSIC